MKSGRDAIEGYDESLAEIVGLGGGMLEEFGGFEVLAAIKLLDRRFQMGIHDFCGSASRVSTSSTTRNSVSVSGLDLREPYFSYISKMAALWGRTLPSGHLAHSSTDSSQ